MTMHLEQYSPKRRQEFIDLNVWWIKRYFGKVEPADMAEFDTVDDVIAQGGMVFFAVDEEGHALATCMAAPRGNDVWELAKLGSSPNREHKGAGKMVFEASEAWATEHGARRIYILTNSSLHPAIHIYESHGFTRYQPKDFGYDRGDYALEKYIDRT